MMTDNEIKKALEKILELMCNEGDLQRSAIISKSLDLINRQEAEIDELQHKIASCNSEIEELKKIVVDDYATEYDNKIKAEAVTEEKQNINFETGDYAKIIANNSGHLFEIGTIVKLEKHEVDYKAFADGDYWWVIDQDLVKIDDDNLLKEMVGENI
jgi:hypothetical protein